MSCRSLTDQDRGFHADEQIRQRRVEPNIAHRIARGDEPPGALRDATQQAAPSERPSVIIVEILGYGGDGGEAPGSDDRRRRIDDDRRSYRRDGAVQILGHGDLTDEEKQLLIEAERRRL